MKGTYYKTPDRLQGVDREARPCQDHLRNLKNITQQLLWIFQRGI